MAGVKKQNNMQRRASRSEHRLTREIIGRYASPIPLQSASLYYGSTRYAAHTVSTYDQTRPDYAWWDQFRRGKIKGYELSGIFAKPVTQIITGYVVGKRIKAALQEVDATDNPQSPITYTNNLIQDFMDLHHATFSSLLEDVYSLGDQYIVVNADGSLSIPSPESVVLKRDPLDYRTVIEATITTILDTVTITDAYTDTTRTITVRNSKDALAQPIITTFDNLLGEIPMVHFANDRSANETNGRPIYEALLRVFSRYNDLMEKGLDGAEIMGNPFPVMEGLEDPKETEELNSDPDYSEVDPDTGGYRQRIVFDVNSIMLIGKGGTFKFASPGIGFTKDIRDMLKSLFLLILEYTRVPEIMWGNEMGQSRASGGEQVDTFLMYIESRRAQLAGTASRKLLNTLQRGGLLQVIYLYLKALALIDRKVVVAPVSLEWESLKSEDRRLMFEWSTAMYDRGTITDETYVATSRIVPNAAEEVEKSKAQNAANNEDAFDNAVAGELNTSPAILDVVHELVK